MPLVVITAPMKYINGVARYRGEKLQYSVADWTALPADTKVGMVVEDGTDLLDAGYATDAELQAVVDTMATDAELAAALANKITQGGEVRFLSSNGSVYRVDTDALGVIRATTVV